MRNLSSRGGWVCPLPRFSCLLLFWAGCSGTSEKDRLKQLAPDAKETVRVSGKVLVDGKPVNELFVFLNPQGVSVSDKVLVPQAQCRPNGEFDIGTYTSKDGAPLGVYKVTMQWLERRPSSNRWVGPDQLKGLYSDPDKSDFEVEVQDKPITGLLFELDVEGRDAVPEEKNRKAVGPNANRHRR
jgi:hypothetical protein